MVLPLPFRPTSRPLRPAGTVAEASSRAFVPHREADVADRQHDGADMARRPATRQPTPPPCGPPPPVEPAEERAVVDPDRWPAALELIGGDRDARAALLPTASGLSYSGWWLSRHAVIDGRAPVDWRLPDAEELVGLYDRCRSRLIRCWPGRSGFGPTSRSPLPTSRRTCWTGLPTRRAGYRPAGSRPDGRRRRRVGPRRPFRARHRPAVRSTHHHRRRGRRRPGLRTGRAVAGAGHAGGPLGPRSRRPGAGRPGPGPADGLRCAEHLGRGRRRHTDPGLVGALCEAGSRDRRPRLVCGLPTSR